MSVAAAGCKPAPRATLQVVGDSAWGGAAYLLVEWCEHLVARGWRVDVLATHPRTAGALRPLGVRLVEDVLIPREVRPLADLAAFRRLVALLRRERYDVVHTYTSAPGFLARIAARLVPVPVVVHHQAGWAREDAADPLRARVYGALEGIALRASTRTICVSRSVASRAPAWAERAGKLAVVRNGIEARPFLAAGDPAALRRSLGVAPGTLLVGSTSRLAPSKDVATTIAAMAELRARRPDLRAVLVLTGEGPSRGELEALAARLGSGSDVRFLGFVPDVAAVVGALDVFVATSLREGLSISILEAMAAGKPIVATGIAPNAELVEDGVHGLLVAPGDAGAVAAAVLRYVDDPELGKRTGAAARERVLREFTLERMFAETLALYEELRARTPRSAAGSAGPRRPTDP